MRAARLKRGAVAVAVAGLALSSVVMSSAASASVKLPKSGVETPAGGTVSETGSTLLYPLFNLWAGGYNTKYPSVTIQTAGTGSGTGISEAENGTIDIGASDAYLSPSVVSANPDLKNIPLAISAQIVVYNIPGVLSHLKLSGKVISEIYQGQITKWNNSAISGLNPGVTLPATPIVTLHRSDSSGDTFLFTQYLSKADASGLGQQGRVQHDRPVAELRRARSVRTATRAWWRLQGHAGLHRLRRHQLPDPGPAGRARLRRAAATPRASTRCRRRRRSPPRRLAS